MLQEVCVCEQKLEWRFSKMKIVRVIGSCVFGLTMNNKMDLQYYEVKTRYLSVTSDSELAQRNGS